MFPGRYILNIKVYVKQGSPNFELVAGFPALPALRIVDYLDQVCSDIELLISYLT